MARKGMELPKEFGQRKLADTRAVFSNQFRRFRRPEYALYLEKKQSQEVLQKREIASKTSSESEYSDSDEEGDAEGTVYEEVPVSHVAKLDVNRDNRAEHDFTKNPKQINSIASNDSGTAFAVGLNASVYKVYRFVDINPNEEHVNAGNSYELYANCIIRKVAYQPRSSNFLCVSNNPRFRLVHGDSLGPEESTDFRAGDRYIHDLRTTTGHVAGINDCSFDSQRPSRLATASDDGCVRLWDSETYGKLRRSTDTIVIANRHEQASRARTHVNKVLHCNRNANSALKTSLITADSNLDLNIWDTLAKTRVPVLGLANIADAPITGLTLANINPHHLLARSLDNSLKLYDLRHFSAPVVARTGFSTVDFAECIFNHNDNYIVAADSSQLHILNSSDLNTVSAFNTPNPVIALHQNYKINHLFTGDLIGSLSIYFNESNSFNGIIPNLGRKIISKRPNLESIDPFHYEKKQK